MKPLILGSGITGLSAIDFCQDKSTDVYLYSAGALPDNYQQCCTQLKTEEAVLERLDQFDIVIASPGFDPKGRLIQAALKKDIAVISDIELFGQFAKAPIIAVTGTNGKSTVATMVAQMIESAGFRALLGGNIGISALSLLKEATPDFYVLEVSSFQLELTQTLPTVSACVLNITPDHLDRHGDLRTYQTIKERLYDHCAHPVINAQQAYLRAFNNPLVFNVDKPFVSIEKYGLSNLHDQANALAALKLCEGAGLNVASCLSALSNFQALPHRCQKIPSEDGKCWIDDSKGTNIGATIAAIESTAQKYPTAKITLLLGGIGKNQDFSLLNKPLQRYIDQCLVFGKDRLTIQQQLHFKTIAQPNLEAAVSFCKTNPSEVILLSPACASFDAFKNYSERGNAFQTYVMTKI